MGGRRELTKSHREKRGKGGGGVFIRVVGGGKIFSVKAAERAWHRGRAGNKVYPDKFRKNGISRDFFSQNSIPLTSGRGHLQTRIVLLE